MNKFYLLLLCCLTIFKASGQSGSLDSTFGNNGIQTTAFLNNLNLSPESVQEVLSSATGEIFVVLLISYSYTTRIAKYLPDGRLDSSYGNAGYSNAVNLYGLSAALQEDKIIVGGYTGYSYDPIYDFALVRYTANGVLDSSFGLNGKVTTDFNNSWDWLYSIALQGDKIVAGGYKHDLNTFASDFALARYTSDGKLDSSFGEGGKVTTDFNNSNDYVYSIALQGDKIIAGGSVLARYTTDGTLDSSFGVNGKVTTFYGYAYSIALQGDKIIAGGSVLARYTTDGTLDSSFGVNGQVNTDFGSNSIVLQGDKIISAGNSNYDFALARYTADGVLDASFGVNGKVRTDVGGAEFEHSIALQGNKIIVGGTTLNVNNDDYNFALARYTANGVLDSSFGENGLLIGYFPSGFTVFSSTAIQGNKIVAAGYTISNNYGDADFVLVRYSKNGKLDSSFGENGRVTTDFGFYDHANSVAIQGGKILVGGYLVLARYTADGRLDSSFGIKGKVITNLSLNSISLQGDKIIVAGYYNRDFALARYTADGKLDASFGVNGKVTTDFKNSYDVANSVAIQGDKIIVGGYTSNYEDYISDFALARYTANGVLDSSFGENGKIITDFKNSSDVANSVAVQGDKIILAGYKYDLNTFTSDFSLVRYTADGALDSSFGENGKVITHLGGSSSIQDITLHENRLYAVGSLTVELGKTYGVIAAYQLEVPEPAISIADVTVSESKKLAVVTLRLSAPTTRWVRVNYTTKNNTAEYPQDYLRVKGTLLLIPGLNTTAKVIIPIVDDNQNEENEQFEVLLTNARNATIMDSVGVITIVDDDNALITKQSTTLRINASPNPSVDAFTVQLLGSNYKQQVSVRVYDVSGRLLEERKNIVIGQSLRLGDQYKAGTYIIEALQGSQSVQTKVIKTGK